MSTELTITGNNLLDVINWLKEGYIICLHNSYSRGKLYYSKEHLESITNEEIVTSLQEKFYKENEQRESVQAQFQ
jgi:hypothetical protein